MPAASALRFSSVQVHLDGIGKVLFETSARAKRITISVRPVKGVRGAIPASVPFEKAEAFVYQKADWIKHHLARIETTETNRTLYDGQTEFRTKAHVLQLTPQAGNKLAYRIGKGLIEVKYPEYRSVSDEAVQDFIRLAIEEAYRLEAKVYLPERVAWFAQKFNLSYRNVTIKKAGTRWGSCSYTNNINLNLHLMRLPQELCDYVILHELAHTIEKNHGPKFWALLQKFCPGAKALDKQLKNYRIAIF